MDSADSMMRNLIQNILLFLYFFSPQYAAFNCALKLQVWSVWWT